MLRFTEELLLARAARLAKGKRIKISPYINPMPIDDVDKQTKVAKKPANKPKEVVLTEHDEAIIFMAWCDAHPVAKNIFATQAGLRTSIRTAIKAKKEGMKAGIPDYLLDVPRGPFHGLRIELKRTKGGVVSQAQEYWQSFYYLNGYCWQLAKGAQEAIDIVKWYLAQGDFVYTDHRK